MCWDRPGLCYFRARLLATARSSFSRGVLFQCVLCRLSIQCGLESQKKKAKLSEPGEAGGTVPTGSDGLWTLGAPESA